jgi:hypothetical protein
VNLANIISLHFLLRDIEPFLIREINGVYFRWIYFILGRISGGVDVFTCEGKEIIIVFT